MIQNLLIRHRQYLFKKIPLPHKEEWGQSRLFRLLLGLIILPKFTRFARLSLYDHKSLSIKLWRVSLDSRFVDTEFVVTSKAQLSLCDHKSLSVKYGESPSLSARRHKIHSDEQAQLILYGHKSLSILLRVLAIYVSARDPGSWFRLLTKHHCAFPKLKTCRRAGFLNAL